MPRINLTKGDTIITYFGTRYDIDSVIEYNEQSVLIKDTDCEKYSVDYEQIIKINDDDVKGRISEYGITTEYIYDKLYPKDDYKKYTLKAFDNADIDSFRNNVIKDLLSEKQTDSLEGVVVKQDILKDEEFPVKIKKENKNINKSKNTEIMTNSMNMNNIFPKVELGEIKSEDFKLGLEGIAILNKEGEYVSFDKEEGDLTDMSGMVFDGGKFFAIPTAEVQKGDLIKKGDIIGYVDGVNKKSIKINDIRSGEIKTIMPKKNMFGFSFYTKVVSMFDMAMGEGEQGIDPMMMMFLMNKKEGESNQMFETIMLMNMMGAKSEMNELLPMLMMNGENSQNMMPMMMMMNMGKEDKETSKLEKMLPMMMMMGGNQGGNQMNQMLPMMMMMGGKSNSKFGKMMPMMMMMGNQQEGENNMMSQMMMMNFLSDMNKKKITEKEDVKDVKDIDGVVISKEDAEKFETLKELEKNGKLNLEDKEDKEE